ncbi:MAG: metallophosphoesterase [Chitinophagales bacterium]|nr:metallophosphoesterase [Chitinophagales bacterium]
MNKTLQTLMAFLIICALGSYTTNAQDLLRGPYQQDGTTTSMKIMWRTSVPTVGWVKVGDTPDKLDKTFTESSSTINHIVLVDGLEPYTRYYYAIGYDDVTLSTGIDHYITTNQVAGDTSGFSLWMIGDMGKANDAQRMARDAFYQYNKQHPVDFMITLGDNAYQNGEDFEYQEKVYDIYDSIFRFLHYYPTPGNHDYNIIRGDNIFEWVNPELDQGPYFDNHELPTMGEAGGFPSGTELYYSYDYGNMHFININSELYSWTVGSASPFKTWLKKDLEANQQHWTIAYLHSPPYTSGSHNSDDFYEIAIKNMRQFIVPILEEAGIDMLYGGHSHVYERSYMINGLYKNSPQYDPNVNLIDGRSGNPDLGETYEKKIGEKGTVYIVCGNSGNYTNEDKLPNRIHPVFYIRDAGNEVTGSVVLEVKGSTIVSRYINKHGEILDKFSIHKPYEEDNTPTGIKENYASLYEMNVYPNPSSEFLNLSFVNPSLIKANLVVTDITGKQILHQESSANGKSTISIDGWKNLPQGSYILSVDIAGRVGSVNVIKL